MQRWWNVHVGNKPACLDACVRACVHTRLNPPWPGPLARLQQKSQRQVQGRAIEEDMQNALGTVGQDSPAKAVPYTAYILVVETHVGWGTSRLFSALASWGRGAQCDASSRQQVRKRASAHRITSVAPGARACCNICATSLNLLLLCAPATVCT